MADECDECGASMGGLFGFPKSEKSPTVCQDCYWTRGMMRPKQKRYKPPTHNPKDHVYASLNERLATAEKAQAEREDYERKWGWLGEVFKWLFLLALLAFFVTLFVQYGFKDLGQQNCNISWRGACI